MVDFTRLTKEQLIEQLHDLQGEITDLRSAPENQRLFQDLQVHQLELEMQNRELREAQTGLELARDRYADLYDFAPLGYVTLDAQGHILEINLSGAELLGKSRSELVKHPLSLFLQTQDIQPFFNYLKQVLDSDGKVNTELRLKTAKDTFRYCYLESKAVRDTQDKAINCRTAIIDISDRKRAEEQLRLAHNELEQRVQERTVNLTKANLALQQEITTRKNVTEQLKMSEERYRSVVEGQTELICRWLPDGTLTFVNDAWCHYFNTSRDAIIGQTFLPLISEEDRSDVLDHVAALNPDNPVTTVEHRVISANGEIRWQRWIHHASFDEQGRITEYQSVGNDLTERRRAEYELQRYRAHLEELVAERTAELQAANSELEAFSYALAHDLRTPLRAVTSFSQILLADTHMKLNSDEKQSLDRIINAGKYMAQLIDDILRLARVTRNEMQFEIVDVSALCREEANRLQQTDPERKVHWNIQDGLGAWGDHKALAIMINNLLGNAWKFSRKSPEVHIEFGAAQDLGEQVFYVKDNGVGFEMQFAPKLFRAFERIHSAEDFEGTGIGLATVRHIIERHRGKVWAQSAVGEGTTIYFHLPRSVEEFKINSGLTSLTNHAVAKKGDKTEELVDS